MLAVAYLIILFGSQVLLVAGAGDSYTKEELKLLPQLLERLKNEITQDYMLENIYLVRFLRAKNWDLTAAESMLRENLKWRQENDLDNILSEDFTQWKKAFPFYYSLDRDGRPAMVSTLGHFNLRKVVLSGKVRETLRYVQYTLETGVRFIQRHSNQTGLEYIGGHLLINLAGYKPRVHACIPCLRVLIEMAQMYETKYPQQGYEVIGINAPRLFETGLNAVRPFLSAYSLNAARLYGFDKAEWKSEILKIYPPNNLSPEFGGTRNVGSSRIWWDN